jgi:hypothetical protein
MAANGVQSVTFVKQREHNFARFFVRCTNKGEQVLAHETVNVG